MTKVVETHEQLKEKCAVFGVYGDKQDVENGQKAARLAFYGLWALQHRGQESSGIVSSDGKKLYRHADQGLVANVYKEEDLNGLAGYMAIGHNRYSTSGGNDDLYNQPFTSKKHNFAFAHNGNLPDTTKLEKFLSQRGIVFSELNDSGMMAEAIGCYIGDGLSLPEAVKAAWPLFTGVFSALAMDTSTLVAIRDGHGVRPLSLAKLEDGYAVASETCAFDTIGAKYVRDIKPGEMLVISDSGLKSTQVVAGEQKLDIFEIVYFARPDSVLLGRSVNAMRQDLGKQMAKEFPIEADLIVPVPDSAIPAAIGYSQASGVPFEMALIKNRYIHRTFIRPTISLRERDLKMKLNPVIDLIKGKRVLLVDDSIVRGSTMRHLVSMMLEAGASEIHLLITCPPVRYPDYYGINTPKQSELLAARMTVPEMCEYVGATSLHFLSFDGMIKATGYSADNFTNSCFTGEYPVSIGKRANEVCKLGAGITIENTKNLLKIGA